MKKLILIAALIAPSGALAQGSDSLEAKSRKGSQMVCRPIRETGSRLSKRKVCLTREQWAEQKRIMRSDLDQAQTRRNEPRTN